MMGKGKVVRDGEGEGCSGWGRGRLFMKKSKVVWNVKE